MLVAGHIITATQSIVSRNVSPIDTAVVSLCAMHAGHPGAMSVVPAHAKLVGTVRTFKPATQDMIEKRLTELVHSIGAAFGAVATLKYERVYPATLNHDAEAMFAADVAEKLVGADNVVRNLDPSMGSEDFSFMLQVEARRVRAAGAGRRGRRLLPAQQQVRLQRRGHSARRRLSGGIGRDRHAAGEIAMDPVRHFAGTYVEARDKFFAATKALGLTVTRHIHPSARGAAGEELSLDVASLGDASAPAMLVLVSGTHGVEGFCGSGCQVGLLHDAEFVAAVRASGVAVVFVHALNPFGFSHLHRTNEDNVDMNRNFRDFAAPPPANTAYAEVHDFIVPAHVAAVAGERSEDWRVRGAPRRQGAAAGGVRWPV